jgi:hypothetical protein
MAPGRENKARLQSRAPAPTMGHQHVRFFKTLVAGHLMNLLFGIVWVIAGVAILVWQFATNTPLFYINVGFPFSTGWLALMLGAYNFVRWYSIRSYRRQRKEAEETWQRRQREHRAGERAEREEAPNPEFDFGNPKPAEPDGSPPAPPRSPP